MIENLDPLAGDLPARALRLVQVGPGYTAPSWRRTGRRQEPAQACTAWPYRVSASTLICLNKRDRKRAVALIFLHFSNCP